MMPNVPQYPVAVAAILRAGYVVVNVNPLYTPRELEHQLKDSGAKAIVIIENFAATLQQVHRQHAASSTWCWPAMGDLLGLAKGVIVNFVVRKVKKMVPDFSLPGAVRFNDASPRARAQTALHRAAHRPRRRRGAAVHRRHHRRVKGAVLLHRNLIANVLQSEAWNEPAMKKIPAGEQSTSVCALPLYHIFALHGEHDAEPAQWAANHPDPNPRDMPALRSRSCRSTNSTAFRPSTRCSTAWPTTPTSTPSTGAT
jgi:long-chain acyl-CoA synthetase